MILYLMRHGKAEDVASRDEERALTKEGIFQAEDTAEAFAAGMALPQKSSLRIQARRGNGGSHGGKLGVHDVKIVSYKDATRWRNMKSYITDEPILFIAHQPSLGYTIEEITGEVVAVRKASLHKIEYDPIVDKGTYVDKIERVRS